MASGGKPKRVLSIEVDKSAGAKKISPDEFLQLLDDAKAQPGGLVVVDVRGSDASAGVVRGAVSAPWKEFDKHLAENGAEWGKAGTVVFYCMYGRERGPSCAQQFAYQGAASSSAAPNVRVLTGGFSSIVNKFATFDATTSKASLHPDADQYVEKFDMSAWVPIRHKGNERLVLKQDIEHVDKEVYGALWPVVLPLR